MPLQRQVIEVPLGVGIDTKSSHKVVQPGALLRAENAVLTAPGEMRKRPGYHALPMLRADGTELENVKKLYSDGAALLAAGNDRIAAYVPESARWSDVGSFGCFRTATRSLAGFGEVTGDSSLQGVMCAGANGYVWACFRDGSPSALTTAYTISRVDTGEVVVPYTVLSGFAAATTCVLRDRYVMVLGISNVSGLSGDLELLVFDMHAPLGSPVSHILVGSGASVVSAAHATEYSYAGTCLAYYIDSGGDPNVLEFDESGVTGNSVTWTAGFNAFGGASFVASDSDGYIYVAESLTTGEAVTIDSAFTVVAGPTAVAGVSPFVAISKSGGGADLYQTLTASDLGGLGEERYIQVQSVTQAGAVGSASTVIRGLAPGGQIFRRGDRVYLSAFAQTDDTLQNSVFVIDSDGNVLARAIINNGTRLLGPHLEVGDKVYVWAANLTTALPSALVEKNTVAVELDFSSLGNAARLGSSSFLCGSQLYEFDRAHVVEHGFHHYPSTLVLSEQTTGSLTLLGTYSYRAVYRWQDKAGNTHYSSPSPVVSITLTGSNNEVSVKVPTLKLTQKEGVAIELYRTANGGSVYYLAQEAANDPSANIVTITDDLADASLTTRPQIYTQGGVLDNIPPPSPVAIASHGNRLFAITGENELWHSKTLQEERGVEFSDAFRLVFDHRGGRLASVLSQEAQLLVAREHLLSRVVGAGPNDLGIGEFVVLDSVSSEVGAEVGTPMAESSMGTIFKSTRKGVRLLDRSLQTAYIGAPVEAYNADPLSDVVLHPSRNEILFCHRSGLLLRYDTFQRQWLVDPSATSLGVVSAAQKANDLYVLAPDGQVLREHDAFEDRDAGYSLDIETPWVKLAGLVGYQRVRRLYILGEWRSPHTLHAWISYDYSETVHEEDKLTFDFSSSADPYVVRIDPRVGRCVAMRVRLFDTHQSGTKESMRLTALRFEVGVKRKTERAARSA